MAGAANAQNAVQFIGSDGKVKQTSTPDACLFNIVSDEFVINNNFVATDKSSVMSFVNLKQDARFVSYIDNETSGYVGVSYYVGDDFYLAHFHVDGLKEAKQKQAECKAKFGY